MPAPVTGDRGSATDRVARLFSQNAGIERYILGTYGFHDGRGNPLLHHQMAYPHIDDGRNMTESIAANHS